MFKIRRTHDGLFSSGGTNPRFSKKGKIWPSRQALSAHLGLVHNIFHVYEGCYVIEYEMVRKGMTPVSFVYDEKMRLKRVRENMARERNLDRERQMELAELKRLKEKYRVC